MVTPERPVLRLWHYMPLAAVVILICLGAFVSDPGTEIMPHQDKLNHALAFLAFAVTLRFARPLLRLRWVMILSVTFGAGIEVVQAFIPGMDATFWDVVADAVGGGIGCLLPPRSWAWIDRWLS